MLSHGWFIVNPTSSDLVNATMSPLRGLIVLALLWKGSPEAVSVLPQVSPLLSYAGFVAGWDGWHRWSGNLPQPPEDLGSVWLGAGEAAQCPCALVRCPRASVRAFSPSWLTAGTPAQTSR